MLFNRLAIIVIIFGLSLTFVNSEVTRDGDKITIRTKRQQCVCIVISQNDNQLRCNCDNTAPQSTQITPRFQHQQQMELQQQLQQIQKPPQASAPNSQTNCGCVLVVVKIEKSGSSGAVQHPQYQCQCDTLPTHTSSPGNNFFAQDQSVGQNFLQSALSQADYFGNMAYTQQPSQGSYTQQPLQQPIQQQQPLGFQPTSAPLTSYQLQGQQVPQNYLTSALNQANYLGHMNPQSQVLSGQQQYSATNQQQYSATNQQLSSVQHDTQRTSQFDLEPATTTCITITIPSGSQSCICGNNYIQCADNMCCHKRYRSHKKDDESAMDIIVDVLKNIKDRISKN